VETTALDNKFASVSFIQHYSSDRYSDETHKLLLLKKNKDGQWRILQETEVQ
jgi:hypothetical protein